MARHEHADLIHLWAEGAEIEYKGKRDTLWCSTTAPQWDSLAFDFRIKPKEPEWYEKIPEHGVLCWVSDNEKTPDYRNCWVRVIDSYKPNESFPYRQLRERSWRYATPLTDDEIKQFLRGEQ